LDISRLLEKENGFLSEKFFSGGSADRGNLSWPKNPLPGKKSPAFRGTKKGGGSSLFPEAGSRRFSPAVPLPPRLFAEPKRGKGGRFIPALFGFGVCFLAGQQGGRFKRPANLERIRISQNGWPALSWKRRRL